MTRSFKTSIFGAACAAVAALAFAPSVGLSAPTDRDIAGLPSAKGDPGSEPGSIPAPSGTRDLGSVDINLAGMQTFDGGFPGALNSQVTVSGLPANAQIIGAQWIDLTFTTENGSWMSELVLSLNDSANLGAAGTFWDMRPGGPPAVGFGAPGTYGPLSGSFTAPSNQFVSGPFPLCHGTLFMYVYESFNDAGASRDALISSGTLRVTYEFIPEPASIGTLAAGGVLMLCRRRRSGRA